MKLERRAGILTGVLPKLPLDWCFNLVIGGIFMASGLSEIGIPQKVLTWLVGNMMAC
jgi:hypothetical protein